MKATIENQDYKTDEKNKDSLTAVAEMLELIKKPDGIKNTL